MNPYEYAYIKEACKLYLKVTKKNQCSRPHNTNPEPGLGRLGLLLSTGPRSELGNCLLPVWLSSEHYEIRVPFRCLSTNLGLQRRLMGSNLSEEIALN